MHFFVSPGSNPTTGASGHRVSHYLNDSYEFSIRNRKWTQLFSIFPANLSPGRVSVPEQDPGFAFSGKYSESFAGFGVYIMYNGKAIAQLK